MSILNELSNKYRIDASEPGSSDKEIKRLVEFSDIDIPKDFLDIIRKSTEIEINVDEKNILGYGEPMNYDMYQNL